MTAFWTAPRGDEDGLWTLIFPYLIFIGLVLLLPAWIAGRCRDRLGLQGEIGILVAGAKADLTVLSLERLRPVASHLGAAVAYASVADVDTVVVDGFLRKSGGELVGVDRASLVRDAEASRDRLLGQIGTSAEALRFSGQLAVEKH